METIDEQVSYLVGEGYSGALDDMLLSYYNTQNSSADAALPDAQYKFMVGLGLSGSLPDMLYENDSLFAVIPSGALLDELGEGLLDELGEFLLEE